MNWKEQVLKDLRVVLETAPDTDARLEACIELLSTVEDQIAVSKVQGARELAEKLKGALKEAA